MGKSIKIFKGCWLAIVLAYTALLPSFYFLFNASNRFSFRWSHNTHRGILLAILLLAGVYLLAYVLIHLAFSLFPQKYKNSVSTLVAWFMCFILMRSVVSITVKSFSGDIMFAEQAARTPIVMILNSVWVKIILYLLLPGFFFWLRPLLMKNLLKKGFFVFSPVVLFFVFFPMGWKTYNEPEILVSERMENIQSLGDDSALPDILIFIFDEWSYQRTWINGALRADLPFFNTFCQNATVYHKAFSLGQQTQSAIPRLLFINDPSFGTLSNDEIRRFVLSGKPHEGKNIFQKAGETWRKIMVGFWLDYPLLLGREMDICLSMGGSVTGAKLKVWGETKRYLIPQLFFLRWLGISDRFLNVDFLADVFLSTFELVHRASVSILEKTEGPIFGVFHYCLPHFPYIWDRKGKRGDIPWGIYEHLVEGYDGNLRFMDTVMEELVTILKKRGRYNNALIIFTSDHSWRFDPDYFDAKRNTHSIETSSATNTLRHVPLVIKMPGQNQPFTNTETTFPSEYFTLITRELAKLNCR